MDAKILAAALIILADAVDGAGVGQAVRQALLPRLEQLGFNWSEAADLAMKINGVLEPERKELVN